MSEFVSDAELVREVLQETEDARNSRLLSTSRFIQHGNTSVLEHSIRVARESLYLARKYHIAVNRHDLVRGALLHDYFLYDWHNSDNNSHRLHGFSHPYTALKNAEEDFDLDETEKNIIVRHMFPFVPIPPNCREAWIVCTADKICSLLETIHRH